MCFHTSKLQQHHHSAATKRTTQRPPCTCPSPTPGFCAAPIDSLKPALRVEDYADELGSIHSFHPSETTRSVAAGAAGASAFTSRAAVGWGSPTTTMRSQKGAGQAGQGE